MVLDLTKLITEISVSLKGIRFQNIFFSKIIKVDWKKVTFSLGAIYGYLDARRGRFDVPANLLEIGYQSLLHEPCSLKPSWPRSDLLEPDVVARTVLWHWRASLCVPILCEEDCRCAGRHGSHWASWRGSRDAVRLLGSYKAVFCVSVPSGAK